METNSHYTKILEDQIRECYAKVVWSHKIQEKCADILNRRLKLLRNMQFILSGLVTTGLLVRVFKGEELALIISTILSAIQFALTTYLKEADLGESIKSHQKSAQELWKIREQYLSLLTDIRLGRFDMEQVASRRDSIFETLSQTYENCPRSFDAAYKEAQKALNVNEELTFSEKEIDNFLPITLKKSKTEP